MIEDTRDFQNFAELDGTLNACVYALNRLGLSAINGETDIDIPYTVNGVPGMASIFRTCDEWTFTTEI